MYPTFTFFHFINDLSHFTYFLLPPLNMSPFPFLPLFSIKSNEILFYYRLKSKCTYEKRHATISTFPKIKKKKSTLDEVGVGEIPFCLLLFCLRFVPFCLLQNMSFCQICPFPLLIVLNMKKIIICLEFHVILP